MNGPSFRAVALLLVLFWSASSAVAAEAKPAPKKPAAKKPVPKKNDPVQMAFALPSGMVLTAKEMEYATGVRAQLEPRLRDALDRVQNSADKSDKLKAVKEVKQIKGQIQAAIDTIIQARMVAYAREMAKRQAAARKAGQKKRAQQKKKKGGQRRRKPKKRR